MSTINSVVSTLLGRPDAPVDHARAQRAANAGPDGGGASGAVERVRIPDSGDIRQRGAKLAELSARLLPAEQSAYAAEIARDGLSSISELITDLRRLVDDAEHFATKTGREEVSLYQRQIDAVARSIQTIADQTSFAGTKLLAGGRGIGELGAGALRGGGIQPPGEGGGINAAEVTFADPRIDSWGFKNFPLPESGEVDLDVNVTQSAQLAGFFLSFGGNNLNLGAAIDQFVIEIEGVDGSRELSFASGTQISDVVAAINSFTNTTGVTSRVSGTGIVLNSSDYGSDQFVSLKVVDDGSIGGVGNIGAYTLFSDNANVADSSFHTDYSSAAAQNGIHDSGQHVAGTINGLPTTGVGTQLRVDMFNFRYQITLTEAGAQSLESFTALTIQRPDRTPLGGRALGAVINGEGLDNAAQDREPAREFLDAAHDEADRSIGSLESFARQLSRSMSESLASAEGIAGLDLDPEAARATAAFAVRSVLTDDPRGLVGALANFSPQRTLSLLAREE